MRVQRKLQAFVVATFLLVTGNLALADYYSDIELDDGVLYVETDDSDDIVRLSREGDEIVVRVFQFHADERILQILYQLSLHEFDSIDALAEDSRIRDEDIEDVQMIQIRTYGANDVVFVDEGIFCPVVVNTGDDSDRIQVEDAQLAFLYGEGDLDVIHGSQSGTNYIYGGGGVDYLHGGDQDDFIYGGDGRDTIWGLAGDDELFGEDGKDTIWGGADNDYLEGGFDGEVDFLYGENGFDKVVGFYFEYIDPKRPRKNWIRRLELEWAVDAEIILGGEIR